VPEVVICQLGVMNILEYVLNHINFEKFPYSKYAFIKISEGITGLEGNALIEFFQG
jgi:hypothetical protein